jgi:hypothetical protein
LPSGYDCPAIINRLYKSLTIGCISNQQIIYWLVLECKFKLSSVIGLKVSRVSSANIALKQFIICKIKTIFTASAALTRVDYILATTNKFIRELLCSRNIAE